jgi:outer membrane protein OmpA-like peptidoglycan-associated protein
MRKISLLKKFPEPYFGKLSVLLLLICALFVGSFSQTKEPTESEALLNVSVTSMNGVPRTGEQIVLSGKKTKKIFTGITDKQGKFSVLISEGDTYAIQYKTIGENVDYGDFDVPSEEGMYTYDLTLQYDPPKTFVLNNILFETGKSLLRKESIPTLNDMVEVMKLKPTMVIEISGHTDNVGTPESNLKLSSDRANAVKNYLVQHGVAATRIQTKGYGDTQPTASNDTDEGRQKNRRTEVKIIKE